MTEITFPDGHVVAIEFDDTQHSYVIAHKQTDGTFGDWRPTTGVTTPLDVVPKPFLTPWGAKEGVEATLQLFYTNPALVDSLEQFFIDLEDYKNKTRVDNKPVMSYYRFNKTYPWFKKVKGAYKDKSKEGQELGTWIHKAIENYYLSNRKELPVVTPDVEGMWQSFLEFDNFFKPIPDEDGLEFFVYSRNYGYSGQGDYRGMINGKYTILDWKSTNRSDSNLDGISVEYFYQLGGLAQAEFERTGKWVDDLGAVNIDKKGEPARVVFASEFGMSPQDAAKAYISHFNTHHVNNFWELKFKRR